MTRVGIVLAVAALVAGPGLCGDCPSGQGTLIPVPGAMWTPAGPVTPALAPSLLVRLTRLQQPASQCIPKQARTVSPLVLTFSCGGPSV